MSILFPNTNIGISFNSLSSSKVCNSFLEIPMQSVLLVSITKIIASAPFVYLPHSYLYYTYPPISHNLKFTPPFLVDLTFNPIVGAVNDASPIVN